MNFLIIFKGCCFDDTGLEDVVDFLEQSFPEVPIAIAHGKVINLFTSLNKFYFLFVCDHRTYKMIMFFTICLFDYDCGL